MAKLSKKAYRDQRHARVRAKISGTPQRPRISIFKSNRHMFVQVIDDIARRTLISSKVVPQTKSKLKGNPPARLAEAPAKRAGRAGKTQVALKIGEMIAEKMKEQGIREAVFDRGGYKYHGRVKAVADGLRAGGIKV